MVKSQSPNSSGLNTYKKFINTIRTKAIKQFAGWNGLNTCRRIIAKPGPKPIYTRTRVVMWDYPRFRYTISMQYGDVTSRRFIVMGLGNYHILEAKYKVVLSTITVLDEDAIISGSSIDVNLHDLPRGAMWLDLTYRTEGEVKNTRWAVVVT